jgi:hypothetical protein
MQFLGLNSLDKFNSIAIIGGGVSLVNLALEYTNNVTYFYSNLEEAYVLEYRYVNMKLMSLKSLGGVNMKFDLVIGNPPYMDPDKGKCSGKLYSLIWAAAEKLAKRGLIFLAPASFIKEYKTRHFTGATYVGTFPGVSVKVGIFEKIKSQKEIVPNLGDWGFKTVQESKAFYKENGRDEWLKNHYREFSLNNLWDRKVAWKKGQAIPENYIGMNNRSGKNFKIFLPNEISSHSNGTLYGTICLLKTKKPEMLKEHIKKFEPLYKEFLQFGDYHVFSGFQKCIPIPEELMED